ncbi:P-loop NTPase fold protein [Bdellovibrio bacteriovorus]|uniref:P-loop NTPase fold protein n=1 Tax=Bdellovibrio bacteriovorus TaxID=959 RepID=UPI0035A6949B
MENPIKKHTLLSLTYGFILSHTTYWIIILATPKSTELPKESFNQHIVELTFSIVSIIAAIRLFNLFKQGTSKPIKHITDLDLLFVGWLLNCLITLIIDGPKVAQATLCIVPMIYTAFRIYSLKKHPPQPTIDQHFFSLAQPIEHEALREKIVNMLSSPEYFNLNFGISGLWGIGKTTLLRKVFERIKQNSANRSIAIWIDLWGLKSSDNIVRTYFSTLNKELTNHQIVTSFGEFSQISKQLIEKSNSINPTELISMTLQTNDDSTIRSRIEELLDRTNKRVLIFLDNIERLAPSEVSTALRLVNLFDDVKNVQHVISYDREQLSQSLVSQNIGDPRRFIEKIVAFEFTVPPMPTYFSASEIQKAIERCFINTGRPIGGSSELNYRVQNHAKSFHTPRELRSFIISFEFAYNTIGLNTNIDDLLSLIRLKVKYPDLYVKLSLKIESIIRANWQHTDDPNEYLKKVIEQLDTTLLNLEQTDLLMGLIPYISDTYVNDVTLLSNRRLWTQKLCTQYFRVDEIHDQISPREAAHLLKEANTGSFSFLTDEDAKSYWHRIEESWTIIYATLIKMEDLAKDTAAKSLLHKTLMFNLNGSDDFTYISAEMRMNQLYSQMTIKEREQATAEIISNKTYSPHLVIKFIENLPEPQKSTSTEELRAALKVRVKRRATLEAMDYHNLKATMEVVGSEISSVVSSALKNSANFVFQYLELNAIKTMKGNSVSYTTKLDDRLFQNFLVGHILFLVNNKVPSIKSPKRRQELEDLKNSFQTYCADNSISPIEWK